MICKFCKKREAYPGYGLCGECEMKFIKQQQKKGDFPLSAEDRYQIALKILMTMRKLGVLEL